MIDRRIFLMGSVFWATAGRALTAKRELDTAYINTNAWTGNFRNPRTDAIGIVGNRIAAMGNAAVKSYTGPRTRVIDVQGAFVTPGFIDNHTHFLAGSARLDQPDLLSATSRDDFAARLGAAARANPGKWILGGSWDEQRLGGELPTRAWIDAATGDTPVAVPRTDLHMYLLNSAALRAAGIDRNTPEVPGGIIVVDAMGEPTGILKDNAKSLANRAFPDATPIEQEKTMRNGIKYALAHGFTQVHLADAGNWKSFETARRLRAKGQTDLRFYCLTPMADWQKIAAIVKDEGWGDGWVRWGGVKGIADGSLGSRTALFHDPYSDDPDQRGVRVIPLGQLKEYILNSDKVGLQIATHAIGDLANDDVLDIYVEAARTNGPRDRRFRIEHAQHLSSAAIPRFAEQNVIASVQPFHAIDDGRWAVKRIGKERLSGTYAFHSLMDSGATVTFGSDWPVGPLNAYQGIYAATTRETIDSKNPQGWLPNEKVSTHQTLEAYTVNNAFAGFQEKITGRIAPGYIADLSIMDSNLLEIPSEKIVQTKILRTLVDGKERYVA